MSPDYAPQDYAESITRLRSYAETKGMALLAGTSMGGYYALKLSELTGLRAIAVNACFEPGFLLARYLSSPAPNYDTGGAIDFTQDMLDAFEPLHRGKIPEPVIIIGEQDDIIPTAWQKEFCRKQGWPWLTTDWGHRVGDVHGEIDALRSLLGHLGYNDHGIHPEGRRLVFVGDLADRGPDSPAVLELVMRYVREGRAQCILGNHELNLLREVNKDGNDWFMKPEEKGRYPFTPVSDQQKKDFRKFLLTLPLALENSELRVVHACWHAESMAKLEALDDSLDALRAYEKFESGLNRTFTPPGMSPDELEAALKDPDREPSFMADLARHDAAYQMGNPVRVLTSGVETPAEKPFRAGGRWRMVAREKWWETYQDKTPVIIGHYWRRFGDLPTDLAEKDGPDLFEGVEPHHWLGPRDNVYCVDFSVGLRHKVRVVNWPEESFSLAALRWPEKQVMHDNGRCADLVVRQKAQS